jgi:hypothetical protein
VAVLATHEHVVLTANAVLHALDEGAIAAAETVAGFVHMTQEIVAERRPITKSAFSVT